MAGIDTPNFPVYYVGIARSGETPGADWAGGLNLGGSNAVGIGINTGDYDPKVQDWSREERNVQQSQNIGGPLGSMNVQIGADFNDNVAFVQATVPVAPGADIVAGIVNRTGKTIPADSWAWGTKTVA